MVKEQKTEGYFSCERTEVAEFVPLSVKTVLDVGCGHGNFLKYIKEITSAETWGIELVPEAAEKAGKVIDKVICSNVENAISLLPDNYFDCITFNDVLEHLVDPWEVLRQIADKLTADGVVVASIPNVRFSGNLVKLLIKKDWQYVDHGILDSTHLRFFTKKSMQRLFEETGYSLEVIKGINATKNWKFGLFNILSFGLFNDTKYLQYLCVGKRKN